MNALITYIIYSIGIGLVYWKCGYFYGFLTIFLYILYELVKIRTLLGG